MWRKIDSNFSFNENVYIQVFILYFVVLVKFILRHGFRVREHILLERISLLYEGATRGIIEIVQAVLGIIGINVNCQDSNGNTALHKAAQMGHISIVLLLLRHGADPFLQNNDGQTPVQVATLNGNLHTANVLHTSMTDNSENNNNDLINLHNYL